MIEDTACIQPYSITCMQVGMPSHQRTTIDISRSCIPIFATRDYARGRELATPILTFQGCRPILLESELDSAIHTCLVDVQLRSIYAPPTWSRPDCHTVHVTSPKAARTKLASL